VVRCPNDGSFVLLKDIFLLGYVDACVCCV
jgi:hypothetical protein